LLLLLLAAAAAVVVAAVAVDAACCSFCCCCCLTQSIFIARVLRGSASVLGLYHFVLAPIDGVTA
jgi:hypothetical protein